jgi:hypothetical protein
MRAAQPAEGPQCSSSFSGILPLMATKRAAIERPVYVCVEYYRATGKEVKQLQRYLEEYEAVKGLGRVARKASGAVELGKLFMVYVLPVIVSYAGNKVLKIVEDRVKDWFKEHGRKEQFITLHLSGQTQRRKIGKGMPKRYRY